MLHALSPNILLRERKIRFSFFLFSSKDEYNRIQPTRICAFCSCDENSIWIRDDIKSYGPASQLAMSPSANGIFRPYLGASDRSSQSSRTSSPEQVDVERTAESHALPMHVGYFFHTNVNTVIDTEEYIWANNICLEFSKGTYKKGNPNNVLTVTSDALSQVILFTFD